MKSLDIAPLGGYRAEDASNWKASKQGATLIVTLPCLGSTPSFYNLGVVLHTCTLNTQQNPTARS